MIQVEEDNIHQINAKNNVAKKKIRRLAEPKKPEIDSGQTNKKKPKNALERTKKSSNQVPNCISLNTLEMDTLLFSGDSEVCVECVISLFNVPLKIKIHKF